MARHSNNHRREKEQGLRNLKKTIVQQIQIIDIELVTRKESSNAIRKRFLILCEGETEQAYFEGIKNNLLFKELLSGVQVQVVAPTHKAERFDKERHLYDNSLQGLIWEAMQRKRVAQNKKNPYDEIWIVVDDDDDRKRLFDLFENSDPKALFYEGNRLNYGQHRSENKPKEAGFDPKWKNYVKMAYSCRAFEVWILLHFEHFLTVYTTSKNIIDRIKIYAPLYEKGICDVKNGRKTTANAYEILRDTPIVTYETTDNAQFVSDKIILAIENTAWLKKEQQYLVTQNNHRFWGVNPFTTVDELLNALLERESIKFERLGQKIIEQDWFSMIEWDIKKQQIHIHIEIVEKQRLLITKANFKDFFWIQFIDNQIIIRIMPTDLLTGTLNLPTINGDKKGMLILQFANLPHKVMAFHFKWKMQKFIVPIPEPFITN
jgi:hypothetical protein